MFYDNMDNVGNSNFECNISKYIAEINLRSDQRVVIKQDRIKLENFDASPLEYQV